MAFARDHQRGGARAGGRASTCSSWTSRLSTSTWTRCAGWGIAALSGRSTGLTLHDRRPHLLRLRDQGQHRLEADARRASGVSTSRRSRCWRRAASIRSRWSARTRTCRWRCCGCWPARTCWSAASTWPPTGRDARGGGGHDPPGARVRAGRAALSLHQLRHGAAARDVARAKLARPWRRRSRGARGARRRMKKAHLLRWRPRPHARRTGSRLARGSPAPPRIGTFLISLPGCRSL